MRKITENAANAFIAGQNWTGANTTVTHDADYNETRMYLHGNLIAESTPRALRVTLAGWPTPTTRERINGLLSALNLNMRLFQRDHAQYIGSTISETCCEIAAHEWVRI